MPLLGVNIDHVATVRQARYRTAAGAPMPSGAEPDPVRGAHEAELGGADIITVHLREDRRHINDRDVERLVETVSVRLNLEMAATEEMVEIACRLRGRDGGKAGGGGPHEAAIVPEGRHEVTTESGLDVVKGGAALRAAVAKLHDAGILVSAFIDADPAQITAAAAAGFDMCEVHTGPYAQAFARHGGEFAAGKLASELERVADAGRRIIAAGLRFNAGHGLNYANVRPVATLPGVAELHIGHSIVSRAVYVGMREAVRQMKQEVTK